MRRRLIPASLAVVLVAAAVAAATSASTSVRVKTIRIGLVLPALSNEAINDIKLGAEARAKQLGGIQILTVGTYKGEEQAKAVENFIAAKVDVIGYDSIDAAAVGPALVKANEAGIPVVGLVSKADKGKHATFIAADFRQDGEFIGTWMNKALGGKGNVALVEGNPADAADGQLKSGFKTGLKKNGSTIKLVTVVPTGWDRAKALTVATDILTGHPDLQGMYGMNDDVALGALQALQAAGREKDIELAGHNGTCEALGSVLKARLDYTVLLFNRPLGSQFVDTALGLLKGKKYPAFTRAPAFGLDTASAKAILAGKSGGAPAALVPDIRSRLQKAKGGCK
jgi:ABC-type sugar transport system substrate-binding protein